MEMNKQISRIDEQMMQIKERIDNPKLCEGTASTYSRITGYYRPVQAWNSGKKQEFMQRSEYLTENL